MKKIALFLLLAFSLESFAQIEIPKDLLFNTTFVDAENHYVAFIPKKEDKNFTLGVPYFDDSGGGYTFKLIGSFVVENGKYVPTISPQNIIARWENLGLKVAIIPDEKVKEMKLPLVPEFLKYYKSSRPENDVLVDKLSAMNGANYCEMALPKLEMLHKQNYKSAKFYFELVFAYNALQKFSEAENAAFEAVKNGFNDELIIKETHYALLHQSGKENKAADFLMKNFKNFKTKSYESESILNQISIFYNLNNFKETQTWIDNYKNEIGTDKYKKYIDQFENALKTKK